MTKLIDEIGNQRRHTLVAYPIRPELIYEQRKASETCAAR